MKKFCRNFMTSIVGDFRQFTMEHRLFNALALMNGAINILGAPALLAINGAGVFLCAIQVLTGIVMVSFYYFARFKGDYTKFIWPLLIVASGFLLVNSLVTEGSHGSAHYYLTTLTIISVILLQDWTRATMVWLIGVLVAGSLFYIEVEFPEWIMAYETPEARQFDVAGNFIFVMLLNGVMVMILVQSLNNERKRSDSLLLNILPDETAEELKKHGAVEPQDHPCATILFTDFEGFTSYAEKLSPNQLVGELEVCFRAFDDVMEKHGIEKIKTIGDAYMAVGGIPQSREDHAEVTLRAALELRDTMVNINTERQSKGLPNWNIRIGLHAGHLIAGVIGKHKFVYDVWGDAVNVASRMESNGIPGEINVSCDLHRLIRGKFETEHRGRIAVKNRGEIDMFLVKRELDSSEYTSYPSQDTDC